MIDDTVKQDSINQPTKEGGVVTEKVPTLSDRSSGPAVDRRKLLRKIDLRLIPFFSLLYLLSFLDRSAIGNARLYGLEKDLKMTDEQYLLVLTVFFFSYAFLEAPSNVALRFIRPSIWLSFLLFVWGVLVILQGLVHNFGSLTALRVLLGVFEAGFYPGVIYYMSCWYTHSQIGFRIAIFTSSQTFSGAFGGLLAAAISNMDGIGGKPAWAWIFIIEGLLTVVASIFSFWIIDDFPETSRFLTSNEREYLIQTVKDDGKVSATREPFTVQRLRKAFTDYRVWIAMLLFAGFDGALYAFALFTPSIINQLGFHATIANLLSVPVYAAACVTACIAGYYGDKIPDIRGYLNILFLGTGIVGYAILVASRNATLSYFAVYMAACAIYPTIPNSIAWLSVNTEGPLKRSIALAMCIGFGNLNGAVSSNVYRSNQTPWYTLGHAIVLGYLSIAFMATLGYWFACRRENARRDAGLRDEVISGKPGGSAANGSFASVEECRLEKGDLWSGFRYSL